MRELAILLRVQLLALVNSLAPVKKSGGKRATGRIALVAVASVALAVLVIVYMLGIAMGLVAGGMLDAIPVFAVLFGSLVGVVFTFMKANGTLFGFADYDLVMSLPISRRVIVASRMAALFLSATGIGAVFMLPLFGVYFAFAGVTPIALAAAIASLLLAPAGPTSVAIFASFALTVASSRFRHANLVYIAFVIVALLAFMVGTYGFIFANQANGGQDQLLLAMSDLAARVQASFAGAYPPAGWISGAMTHGSISMLAMFLAFSFALPALCLEILQRGYLAINGMLAGQGGRSRSSAKTLAEADRALSPFKALVVKELRTQIGISAYAINCLFGYALMLMAAIALSTVNARELLEAGALNGMGLDPDSLALKTSIARLFLLIPWMYAFCAIASPAASVAVSLEGRCAWLMATAPLSTRTILSAKLAANAVPTAGALAVSAAILLVSRQVDALGAVEIVVLGFGIFYGMVNLGMAIDVSRPNFSWSSAQEVVKRSLPIMVCVIGGMMVVFGLGGLTMAAAFNVGDTAAHAVTWASGIIGLAAGQILFLHTTRAAMETFYLA